MKQTEIKQGFKVVSRGKCSWSAGWVGETFWYSSDWVVCGIHPPLAVFDNYDDAISFFKQNAIISKDSVTLVIPCEYVETEESPIWTASRYTNLPKGTRFATAVRLMETEAE